VILVVRRTVFKDHTVEVQLPMLVVVETSIMPVVVVVPMAGTL